MAYIINTTNGTILTTLIDGSLDTDTTSISLIGRSYQGFGESVNENFVKILENFANTSPPPNPLPGQLWWDTSESRIKVYDGANQDWRAGGGPIVSPSEPDFKVVGDTWIDTTNEQLKFFISNDEGEVVPYLAGPGYSATQGQTGFITKDAVDISGQRKTYSAIYVGNTLIGVMTAEQITPRTNISANLPSVWEPGITFVTGQEPPKIRGTATNSEAIAGTSSLNFMRTDINDETLGTIRIKNDSGLSIGNAQPYLQIRVDSNRDTIFDNNRTLSGMKFDVKTTGAVTETALSINAANKTVSIFKQEGGATLDVNGDTVVRGDLTVEGTTTSLSSTELVVADKNIVLADSSVPTDLLANGGGITLKGSTDHTIIWSNDEVNGDYWTFSDSIDIASGKDIRVNNVPLLDETRLHDSVTRATGITRLGNLQDLTIQNGPVFNGSTITNVQDLTFDIIGKIVLQDSVQAQDVKIQGVLTENSDPDSAVTSKAYVDDAVQSAEVSISFDITNYDINAEYNDVIVTGWLEQVAPAIQRKQNTIARVHCISYISGVVTRTVKIFRAIDELWVFQNNEAVNT